MLKPYCASLITYLATSKKPFVELVTSTNQFTDEAEASLKEIISESKEAFMKAKS
jgi:F0F1-type ATP synthase alpha subunit